MVGTGASQQHYFHPGETRGDRAHGGTRQLSDPRSLGAEGSESCRRNAIRERIPGRDDRT